MFHFLMRTIILFIGFVILIDCLSCQRHRNYENGEPIQEEQIISESESSEGETPYNDTIILESPKVNDSIPQQILYRDLYTLSYNSETRCPNWVAWTLTRETAQGLTEKKIWFDENGYVIGIPNFRPEYLKGTYLYDAEAQAPSPEFADWDLMPSGMSHGHMCPAADCKMSRAAMNQSFLLTNICVQAEKLNTGSWNKLETSCRNWAIKYGRVFIVTGPIFYNGIIPQRMGNIAIPDSFYKVILCMEGTPKAIGFVFANNNEKHNRDEAVRSVDDVEQLTGIDFFPQLPNDIEEVVESQANYNAW